MDDTSPVTVVQPYLALLSTSDFISHGLYVFAAVVAVLVTPMFAAACLFGLAYGSGLFNEVVHALLGNPRRICTIIALGAVFVWTYELIAIAFLNQRMVFSSGDSWADVCFDFKSCFGLVKPSPSTHTHTRTRYVHSLQKASSPSSYRNSH